MADLYKEYLAHVPAKWTTFSKDGFRLGTKDLNFTSKMPRSTAECKSLVEELEASEEARGARARGANRKRGGDSWAAEMKTIVEMERVKAEAEQNAAELEEHIRVKHQRRMAQKERSMIAPTINGSPMPVAFHALRDAYPAETAKYQAMLSAGGDLAISMAREAVDAKAQARQAAREKAQLNHLKKVGEGIDRANEERAELMKHYSEANTTALIKATRRREEQAELDLKARTKAAEEAAQREAKVAARLQAEAMQRSEAAEQAAREAKLKLDRMRQYKESVANEIEQRLNAQFEIVEERRAIMETLRHQVIASHKGERIYQEVMARREQQKQAELQALKKLEEKRDTRLEAIVQEKREEHKALIETHRRREERVDDNLDSLWRSRSPVIDAKIQRAHSDERQFRPRERSTPAFLTASDMSVARAQSSMSLATGTTPLALRSQRLLKSPRPVAPTPGLEGLTDARLAHAAALKARLAAEDAERRREAELRRNARDDQLLAKQVNEHHSTQARLQEEENKRLQIRASAAARAIERQTEIDNDAAKRAAAAEKHLEEVRKEQSTTLAEKAAAKAKRIATCLDEVNVVKVNAVHDAVSQKASKREAFERQRQAQRNEEAMLKAAQIAERTERMERAVREAEEARYNTGLERRRQHDERVNHASSNHQQHLDEVRAELNNKSVKRSAKVEAAIETFNEKQRRLAENVRRNEEALAAAQASNMRELERELRRQAEAREDKMDRYLENHSEFHAQKVQRALQKAAYARARAHTSLEERREAAVSVSPPAVRAKSAQPPSDDA